MRLAGDALIVVSAVAHVAVTVWCARRIRRTHRDMLATGLDRDTVFVAAFAVWLLWWDALTWSLPLMVSWFEWIESWS